MRRSGGLSAARGWAQATIAMTTGDDGGEGFPGRPAMLQIGEGGRHRRAFTALALLLYTHSCCDVYSFPSL